MRNFDFQVGDLIAFNYMGSQPTRRRFLVVKEVTSTHVSGSDFSYDDGEYRKFTRFNMQDVRLLDDSLDKFDKIVVVPSNGDVPLWAVADGTHLGYNAKEDVCWYGKNEVCESVETTVSFDGQVGRWDNGTIVEVVFRHCDRHVRLFISDKNEGKQKQVEITSSFDANPVLMNKDNGIQFLISQLEKLVQDEEDD